MMMTVLTLVSVIHFSGSHSGAVRTSSEVPGRSEEAKPARRRTCAAHGHLPALPRYCPCSCPFFFFFCIPHQCTPSPHSVLVSRLSAGFVFSDLNSFMY